MHKKMNKKKTDLTLVASFGTGYSLCCGLIFVSIAEYAYKIDVQSKYTKIPESIPWISYPSESIPWISSLSESIP